MADATNTLTDDQRCRQVFPDSFCDLVNGADKATVSNPMGGAPIPVSEVQSGALPDADQVAKAQQVADSPHPLCQGIFGLPSAFCDYWPYAFGFGVLATLGVIVYGATKAAPLALRVYAPELAPTPAVAKAMAAFPMRA